jgi:hypothetical protein
VRAIVARLALGALVVVVLALAYIFVLVRPSNDRVWEYGMTTLPDISISGGTVSVRNLRDFDWSADGPVSSNYVDRTFALERITRVWFIEEPFTVPPFNGFEGVAHTYFVFDFQDQPPVAISVEARRERGETYDVVRGLFNQYELIYIWGTERDLTGSRAVLEKNRLYMYPLSIPNDAAQQLFKNLAEASQHLETQPRFYNSLTSNCTNELAKAANMVKPGAIPPNIALVLPGYADKVLYDLGFIPHDLPLADVRRKYFISDTVAATYEQPDFSSLLRARLTA